MVRGLYSRQMTPYSWGGGLYSKQILPPPEEVASTLGR